MSAGDSGFWDRYWSERRASGVTELTHEVLANAAVEMIGPLAPGDVVVDLGCGDGELTARIAERLDGDVPIVGVDLSVEGLQAARSRLKDDRVFLVRADATALPFRSGAVPAIASFGYASVAAYWKPPIQEEIARVLEPEGVLVTDYRNHASLTFLLTRPRTTLLWLRRYWRGEKQFAFGPFGLRRYYAGFGLKQQRRKWVLCFPPVERGLKYWRRLERVLTHTPLGPLFARVLVVRFVQRAGASDA